MYFKNVSRELNEQRAYQSNTFSFKSRDPILI
jgi:hypothetical protein